MKTFVTRTLLAATHLLAPAAASASPFVQVGDTLKLQDSVGSLGGGEFIAHAVPAGSSTASSPSASSSVSTSSTTAPSTP